MMEQLSLKAYRGHPHNVLSREIPTSQFGHYILRIGTHHHPSREGWFEFEITSQFIALKSPETTLTKKEMEGMIYALLLTHEIVYWDVENLEV